MSWPSPSRARPSTPAAGLQLRSAGQARYDLVRFSPITSPWIGSLQPTRGKVGITLTINGWNFGAHRGTSKVYFGSKAVTTYVSWSATKIKVRVPTLAKGKKLVTVKTCGRQEQREDVHGDLIGGGEWATTGEMSR